MAFLEQLARWLPERVVDNAEMGAMIGCEVDWIRSVSGIEERRFAADGETTSLMGLQAAKRCLQQAGVQATAIGYLICSCGTSERRFPGPAASIASALGCGEIPAIDLPLASAGALVGLDLARDLAPRYGRVLVVATEKMSSVVLTEPMERGVSMLFGDGAGACLVGPEHGRLQIVDSFIASDGQFADDLALPFGAPLSMNGRSVILHASRKIPRAIGSLLERNGLRAADVASFVMHQANVNLIWKVADALDVASERFFTNIARYGNTSSASLLIAAAEWMETSPPEPGEHTVLTAFGAGYQWGAMLLRAV
ncbi:MAG: ketoacyl-ACP synthase III [Bryobacterales bacterium]|nr:ketoacyl-ACP synthase III [Bryobacterales bacterium]